MGVDSIGATLQQDGVPDMANEDVTQCKELACLCAMQQAWVCDLEG